MCAVFVNDIILHMIGKMNFVGENGVDFVITWDGTTKKILNGMNGTPNVPKFKYAEYWQERVWGLNNPNGRSDLDFSAIASTNGVRLEPDDQFAWPGENNLRIGEGDGQIGTALWVQDGQLKVGKERSIYTIFGTNVSNYFARKEENLGDGVASDETVVLLDQGAYWLGKDGIYKDGQRISDLIEPDLGAINKGSVEVIANTWDSQTDFASKGHFYGTTATASGFLTNISTTYGRPPAGTKPNIFTVYPDSVPRTNIDDFIPFNSGTTYYQFNYKWLTTTQIPEYANVYIEKILFVANSNTPLPECSVKFASVTIQNDITKVQQKTIVTDFGGVVDSIVTADFGGLSTPKVLFNGYDLKTSSILVKVEGCGFTMDPPTINQGVTTAIQFLNSTTNQYLSEVTTLTMVTAWGNFNAISNANEGSFQYFVRTSTSSVNIATQTWTTIVPGAIINQPTVNNYIQWAATMTSISTSPVTNIDSVEFSHIEGISGADRAFAISWKNRYWLATSTGSSTLTYLLVKSKITNKTPHAWMPVEGINIRAFAKNNDILYGGSSTSGTVYRLDYGTSFDGTPIEYIYDTPDLILGDNYRTKNIKRYMLDAKRDSGLTYTVKTSLNGGDFTSQDFPFNGTGRQLQEIFGVKNPAKSIRLRLTHNVLDKKFEIYDISVFYDPTDILRQ